MIGISEKNEIRYILFNSNLFSERNSEYVGGLIGISERDIVTDTVTVVSEQWTGDRSNDVIAKYVFGSVSDILRGRNYYFENQKLFFDNDSFGIRVIGGEYYFYNQNNAPMNAWDPEICEFYPDRLPELKR